MIYDTIIDYILDNRNGFEKDVAHLSDEDKETVLAGFDWAACEVIKEHISYEMFKSELKEHFGEDSIDAVELASARNFMLLDVAVKKYLNDVKKGRKVGYSAAEDEAEKQE